MRNLIIYVDDDRDDLVILQEAFREIPEYELLLIEKAERLLPVIDERKDQICLVVLDINMPVNGIDILRDLKGSAYHDVPILMLSSSVSPKDRSAIERLHTELIEKPSDYPGLHTLTQKLRKHCS